jgi:hypothetical protein
MAASFQPLAPRLNEGDRLFPNRDIGPTGLEANAVLILPKDLALDRITGHQLDIQGRFFAQIGLELTNARGLSGGYDVFSSHGSIKKLKGQQPPEWTPGAE